MWQTITKWHRWAGIVSALFVVMLVITGIMLNHTDVLNLDEAYVQNSHLLDLYNIHPASEPLGFEVSDHWISQVGERVYFDETEIAKEIEHLTGAVSVMNEIAVAMDEQILLLNVNGQTIESLDGLDGVPSGMRAIGITEDKHLVVKGSHGNYILNLPDFSWHETAEVSAVWSKSETLPEKLLEHLLQLYRGKGLSAERVILDLHSGRLFGIWGVYVIDAAAILFLLLAISGVMMWYKRTFQS